MLSTIGDGVEVKKSTIKDAGRGLFALKVFHKGDYITLYDGELITRQEARRRTNLEYMASREGIIIDGQREPRVGRGGGSFANGSVYEKDANASIACDLARLIIRAKKTIDVGDEIVVCYGRRGFTQAMPPPQNR